MGPTAGAATLINKKDAPHAIPIARIKNQSINAVLFIILQHHTGLHLKLKL